MVNIVNKTGSAFFGKEVSESFDNSKEKETLKSAPKKTIDFWKLFINTFGITTFASLTVIPALSLKFCSKEILNFLKIGAIGGGCTAIVQALWAKFVHNEKLSVHDQSSKLNRFYNKLKSCQERIDGVASPLLASSSSSELLSEPVPPRRVSLDGFRMIEKNRPRKKLYRHDFGDGFVERLLNKSDFTEYKVRCCGTMQKNANPDGMQVGDPVSSAKTFFKLMNEEERDRLTLQHFLDKVGALLKEKNALKEKITHTSVETSEEFVEETKVHFRSFKWISLLLRLLKEFGNLGKMCKFWEKNFLEVFYDNYNKPLTSYNDFISACICLFEYSCIYSRGEEIKALDSNVQYLARQKQHIISTLASLEERQSGREKLCRQAIHAVEMTMGELEIRRKELAEKNKFKLSEITLDLFETFLAAAQALLDLLKTKTHLFKDLPNLLTWINYIDEGINVFSSVTSLVVNARKIFLTNEKKEKIEKCHSHCLEVLQKVGEKKGKDLSFVKFLQIKKDALETSKKKYKVTFFERVIKVVDSIFSTVKYSQLFLLAFGIAVGTSMTGAIGAGATIFALASLGFSVYRFCYYDIYLQRHQIINKINMVRLRFERGPKFKALVECERKLDEQGKKIDCIIKTIAVQKEAIARIDREARKILEEKISALSNEDGLEMAGCERERLGNLINGKTVEVIKAVGDAKMLGGFEKIKDAKRRNKIAQNIVKKELMAMEEQARATADNLRSVLERCAENEKNQQVKNALTKLSCYSLQQIEAYRQELEAELQNPASRTLWTERLSWLGFPAKVMDASYILSLAVSKRLPAALQEKINPDATAA